MARLPVILALVAIAAAALMAATPGLEQAAVSASAPAQSADCLSGQWWADDADAYARIVTSVSGLDGDQISIVRTGGELVMTLGPDGRWEARYRGYTAEVAGAGGRANTSYTLDGAVRGAYDASAPGALSATMTELALDVYGSATLPVLGGTVDVTIRAGEAVPGLPAPPAELGSAGYVCDGNRLTLLTPPPAWFFLPFNYTRLSGTATSPAPDATSSPAPSAPAVAGGAAVPACAAGGDIVTNVTVPENTACALSGVRVLGNIDVRPGASVTMTEVALLGNLRADRAASISVDRSNISGNIRSSGSGDTSIRDSRITGDAVLDGSTGVVTISGNDILGRVEISGGAVQCSGNSVLGLLRGCP